MSSIVLNGGANGIQEAADSNGSVHSNPPSKRARTGLKSSAKFKGTVKQQNGHWGAQIYADHQRIWLGTFKSEEEAAMAYDSAAIRLRSGDSHRNFPLTKATAEEPKFQYLYSTEVLLNMIKDGSYQAKFEDYLRNTCLENLANDASLGLSSRANKGGVLFKQLLFQKELTPSDVGKLNRFVIPKKYAVKYLPHILEENMEEKESEGAMVKDMEVVFHDRAMRSWKFRYCYWCSSQSFVFTRGWSLFVKEKGLKANDTIAFYLCERREVQGEESRVFAVVDIVEENGGLLVQEARHSCLGLHLDTEKLKEVEADKEEDGKVIMEEAAEPIPKPENSGFRLFGVQIMV